ncbi:VIT domain-containing protein [Streptomyces sp. NPDC051940]|uniref:VIT domain-containing protein n=1 Tax=Streptomyces sp. NPDC051940 TaxID=3155675 RepID=UPI003448387A
MTVPITPLAPEEGSALPDAGLGALRTERGNLPLESVEVRARISGLTAGIEVVQGFRNPFDVPLEATYIFPLPDRAAVTAFRMEADDHVIEGQLKERGQARADYDRAVAEGRRAAIAEEERPDVFTMRVGNIVPGERVTVRLTLSQPLPYEDGAAEFRFPLVVAPRYIPGAPLPVDPAGSGSVPDTDAVPDASRITPPVLLPGFPNPVRLSLDVDVDPAGLELREIRSSLHEVTTAGGSAVEGSGVEGGVRLSLRPGERLDRDFILRLGLAASDSLLLVPDEEPAEDGAGTFALTVVPGEGPEIRRPRDVVLVLDRSGSMGGWKMVAARRAAARIIDTLISDDRFAVLSFDHQVERPARLPEDLAPATDRHRYRAVEHLARLEARGGTEMLRPLQQALQLLAASKEAGGAAERDQVLVLVTDGQVGHEDQILERIGASLSGVRVHTVGIDRAVNAGFLGRLAALGAGRCELVESEDRLDEAMEHIHRRIGAPLVTGLSLKAEGLEPVTGTVTHAGSLFPGVPLQVFGRYRRVAGAGAPVVAVRGLTAEGESWERRVTGAEGAHPAVRAVWARARLRALEDRYLVGEHALEKTIVDTSLRFGVLCRFTAFVAVDTRVVAEGGVKHRVTQPVESPSGWDMIEAERGIAGSAPGGFQPLLAAAPLSAPRVAPMAPGGIPAAAPPPAPGAAAPQGFAPRAGGAGPVTRGARGLGRAAMHRGRPAAAPAQAGSGLDLRPLLREELARLKAAEASSAVERRRSLADLGTRLSALLTPGAGGPDQARYAELAELARELRDAEQPQKDLEALWTRTVTLLTALVGTPGDPGDGTSPEGDRPRPFWKRG